MLNPELTNWYGLDCIMQQQWQRQTKEMSLQKCRRGRRKQHEDGKHQEGKEKVEEEANLKHSKVREGWEEQVGNVAGNVRALRAGIRRSSTAISSIAEISRFVSIPSIPLDFLQSRVRQEINLVPCLLPLFLYMKPILTSSFLRSHPPNLSFPFLPSQIPSSISSSSITTGRILFSTLTVASDARRYIDA